MNQAASASDDMIALTAAPNCADELRMRWIRLLFGFVSVTLSGQGIDDPELTRIIQGQLDRNAKTVAVDPGSTRQVRLSVRPAGIADMIVVGTEDRGIILTLRLPNGAVVSQGSAANARFLWETSNLEAFNEILPVKSCGTARNWTVILLPPNLPAGVYIIEAQGRGQTRRSTVCATYFSQDLGADPDVVGSPVKTDRGTYQLGDLVTISVPVLDAARPVRNARVDAVIRDEELGTEAGRLRLTDTRGDGNYRGVFQPSVAAHYNVSVTISGRTRNEIGGFFVVPLQARLIAASLVSAGPNAQAQIEFEISAAGEYKIGSIIRSSNGKSIANGSVADLTPGRHIIMQEFQADDLRRENMVPPYALVGVSLVNGRGQLGMLHWLYENGKWRPD